MFRDRFIVLSLAAVIATGGLGATSVPAVSAAKKQAPVGVVIGKPTTKPGDKCAKGTAGCSHGKFTGTFFGN